MAFLGVLPIAIANCVVFLFLSFLAVGDGSFNKAIWYVGYSWIAVVTIAAIALSARGQIAKAKILAWCTLPVGFAVAFAATFTGRVASTWWSAPAAFTAVCRNAGATFIAKPVTPVRSIAYDWTGEYAPQINFFTMYKNGVISKSRGNNYIGYYPAAIEFIENRCCQYEGRPANGVGPFVRHRRIPGSSEYFGVPELTADALVMYQSTPIFAKGVEGSLIQYDVTVSDRRDGRLLARLRYLVEGLYHRGCGSTAEGVMDERSFVLKAVNIR